jgi:hypothetical protein
MRVSFTEIKAFKNRYGGHFTFEQTLHLMKQIVDGLNK